MPDLARVREIATAASYAASIFDKRYEEWIVLVTPSLVLDLVETLEKMRAGIDKNDCDIDHNGWCQTHYSGDLPEEPCAVWAARKALRDLEVS